MNQIFLLFHLCLSIHIVIILITHYWSRKYFSVFSLSSAFLFSNFIFKTFNSCLSAYSFPCLLSCLENTGFSNCIILFSKVSVSLNSIFYAVISNHSRSIHLFIHLHVYVLTCLSSFLQNTGVSIILLHLPFSLHFLIHFSIFYLFIDFISLYILLFAG